MEDKGILLKDPQTVIVSASFANPKYKVSKTPGNRSQGRYYLTSCWQCLLQRLRRVMVLTVSLSCSSLLSLSSLSFSTASLFFRLILRVCREG